MSGEAKARVEEAIRVVAERIGKAFSEPDDGLLLTQRYTIAEAQLSTAEDPERMITDTVRRMMAAISVEMLRERWRVPGIPRFTIRQVRKDEEHTGPGTFPGSLLIDVAVASLGADLGQPRRDLMLREAMVEARNELALMAAFDNPTVPALQRRAEVLARLLQTSLDLTEVRRG